MSRKSRRPIWGVFWCEWCAQEYLGDIKYEISLCPRCSKAFPEHYRRRLGGVMVVVDEEEEA